MKKSFSLLALALLSTPAFASGSGSGYLVCSNGSIEQMGDSHFAMEIFEDGLTLLPYEGSISVDAADCSSTDKTIAILDKKLDYSSEGTELKVVVNALAVISSDEKKVELALSLDHAPLQTYVLSCEKK
jgi:hypothetical protein